MFGLLGLELRTLYLDRDEHDSDQRREECQQLERFGQIADKLGTAISTSQTQFNATMTQFSLEEKARQREFDTTMQKSDQIAAGVREDREAITGSMSYPVFLAVPNSPTAPQGLFEFTFWVRGKYPMRGVSAQMKRAEAVTDEERSRDPVGSFRKEFTFEPIPISESGMLPGAHLVPGNLTLGVYQFDVFSLSGIFTEMLTLKRNEKNDLVQTFVLQKNGKIFLRLEENGQFIPKLTQ